MLRARDLDRGVGAFVAHAAKRKVMRRDETLVLGKTIRGRLGHGAVAVEKTVVAWRHTVATGPPISHPTG